PADRPGRRPRLRPEPGTRRRRPREHAAADRCGRWPLRAAVRAVGRCPARGPRDRRGSRPRHGTAEVAASMITPGSFVRRWRRGALPAAGTGFTALAYVVL